MSTDESSDKVLLLFEECIEIPDPEKRQAYLNDACAGSAHVRAQVEKLLRAHEESRSFLRGGTPPRVTDLEGNVTVPDFKPGEIVGNYRLMGMIGEGSTSTVFLAEQEEPIHRWVALKIVKPGMDSRKVILRFGLERQALALMDHPGIAKLLDAGATPNGRPFFVMELVSGVGITQYCDEHRLSISKRLELFIEVCNAVFHAHQRGIIHRDLKPENILVSDVDGRTVLKIVDFGIAKVLNTWGEDSATRTSLMPFLGTPAYMSPEQVRLTSTALDTRTDIYSLGALLYELLVGHPPFDPEYLVAAGLEEMCHIIRTQEPIAPSVRYAQLPASEQAEIAKYRSITPFELRRRLVGDLDWITLRALEKPRDRRYGTCLSLARDIKRYFEHMPVSAAKPSRRYRLGKLMKRKRKLMLSGGIAAGLMLVSVIVIIITAANARVSARQARESEQLATAAQQETHAAMVSMHVASGISAAENRRPDQAVLWFANAARMSGPDTYQSKVNARRAISWMAETPMPVSAFKLSTAYRQLEFSKDSRYLLALCTNGSWRVWDARIRDLLPWTREFGPVRAAAWSPDSNSLAIVLSSGEVRVHQAASGALLHSLHVTPAPATIGFTPDARYLVFGNSSLHAYDLSTGSPEEVPRLNKAFVGLAFSRQSNHMAGVTEDGWTRIISLEGDANSTPKSPRLFPHRAEIRSDSCSSKTEYQEDFLKTPRIALPEMVTEKNRLITRTGPYEVTLWDLVSGTKIQQIDKACCSCRFTTSQQAGLMACGIQGGKVGLYDIETGEPRQILPSQGTCVLDIDFGMGGTRLVTAEASGMARIWGIEEGTEIQPAMNHCTDVDLVAFSGNGRMVATSQPDGLVRIWNVFDIEPKLDTHTSPNVPTMAHLDPNGGNFILTREPAWAASEDACIRQATLFSTQLGTPIGVTMTYEGCVEAADFSPDSNMVAIGVAPCDSRESGRLDFYEVSNRLTSITGFELPSAPGSIAWNPVDWKVAVICHNGELLVAKPGDEIPVKWSDPGAGEPSHFNIQVEFTPDGSNLISLGSDGKIEVRDASTGSILYPPLTNGPDGFWSFSLSSDGRYLATTTVSGTVTIWNIERGIQAGSQLKHPNWVYRCQFSPDGKSLVTASHDGEVRLWNLRSRELSSEPMVHPSEVYDAAFTPDSRFLLTACRDGKVRIWDVDMGKIVTPPIHVGERAFNVEIAQSGNHAVVGTLGNNVSILSLSQLRKDVPYSAEDLCLIAEVASSSAIQNGTVHDLTTSEWLDRYQRLTRLHPEALQSGQAYTLENLSIEKAVVFPETIGVDLGKRTTPSITLAASQDPH